MITFLDKEAFMLHDEFDNALYVRILAQVFLRVVFCLVLIKKLHHKQRVQFLLYFQALRKDLSSGVEITYLQPNQQLGDVIIDTRAQLRPQYSRGKW